LETPVQAMIAIKNQQSKIKNNMGYAVLHLNKATGNDAGTSAHIERTIHPKNADDSRTHLNRELIPFSEGIRNRTDAIQHRIESAGIKRKIGKNQVRALRVMLSGTPEDMERIVKNGRLDEWSSDNVDWLKRTFGADNLVSAVLHLDEKTPHIHATVVPIVSGERRKAKPIAPAEGKKKYRKKDANAARLCADDVMTRDKLKAYQDSYAACMQKYGLQRGIEGSEARHINTGQYYTELYKQNQVMKEDIESLKVQKRTEQKEVDKLKGQAHGERIKESIGDLFTGSKTKKLEQENAELKDAVQHLETQLTKEKTETRNLLSKLEKQTAEKQQTLDKIFGYFPDVNEKLFIVRLCELVGFGVDLIKELLSGKRMSVTGKFYSPEFKRHFEAHKTPVHIEKSPKLRLCVDNMDIYEWFRVQNKGFLKTIGVNVQKKQDMKRGL
jgi:hypothetical protein